MNRLYLLCGLLFVSCTSAQEIWFEDSRNKALSLSVHSYVYAKWVDANVELPTAERLESLRRRVAGRPDHPNADELRGYERRLIQGPDIRTFSIWFGEPGQFRRNIDESGTYADIVVRSNRAWSLAPTQLTIIEDLSEGYPPGYKYGPWDSRLRGTLAGFLYGALSIGFPGVDLALHEFTTDSGESWRARIGSEEHGIALELKGSYSQNLGIGRARSAEVILCEPAPQEIGRHWVFSEWTTNPVGEGEICSLQEEFAPDGRPVRQLRLEQLHAITRDAFQKVTSQPTKQRDAVRGSVAIPAVHRFPNGTAESTVLVLDKDGQVQEVIRESDFTVNKKRRLLQRAGYLAAVGVIIIVVTLRLRGISGKSP